MRVLRYHKTTWFVSALCVLVFAASCGGGAASVRSQTPGSRDYISGEPLYNTSSGKSLASLRREYPIVFVGTVESIDTQYEDYVTLTPQPPLPTQATVEGKPPRQVPERLLVSLVHIKVDQWLSDPQTNPTVTLYEVGGEVKDAAGVVERWHDDGDELLDVGQSYLIFSANNAQRAGTLVAAPWSKFRVVTGRVAPLTPTWKALAAVQSVTGQTPSTIPALLAATTAAEGTNR